MTISFSSFCDSLDADPGRRGKQFEHFVKWFLKADPEWSTQVDEVWLWDEYPDRWGADCGIDLVFRHKNGERWAVQAKCYSPDHVISKQDVDKFLSESNRQGIDKRLLIATTDRIGTNARHVCDGQEKKVVRFLLSNFESADLAFPSSFEELHKTKRKERPAPREHQREAIAAVVENFEGADRGQLIMACGTGKTFTSLWIKERLESDATLVLLPSLGLLSQTLHEWTLAAKIHFDVLCVCSDDTVAKRGKDETLLSIADLAFPVSSDIEEIKRFLRRDGAKVVFSTYQSSPLVADAQSDASIPAFDLVVADEAHRCAGKVAGDFSTVLSADRIRAKKRLFATATPRTYSSNVKKAADERGVEIVGMDDESVFGKVLYSLPFGEAIKRDLLTDYRVLIIGVDSPTIAAWIQQRELLRTDSGIESDAESLAARIGLLKAYRDYDLRRVISFHGRVERAEKFSEDISDISDWVGEEHRPSGAMHTDFVSGAMPTDKRRRKLARLKALEANERGLLSNARCLSEGVDVPSLDGVAFIDPRGSQIDIIQAVGRAIRLSTNKTVGTIVLPVFIEEGDSPVESIEASNFKPVWDVLTALKAHDDVLASELNLIRTDLGRHPGRGISTGSLAKVKFDLPASVDAGFPEALRTCLVERATDTWDFYFGLLQAFVDQEGHAMVNARYKTSDGYQLGMWVSKQRGRRASLTPERKERLGALPGWSWDPFSDQWEEGFGHLKAFVQRAGHARATQYHETPEGYRLGAWINTQRQARDNLSSERKESLNALPGWSWDPHSDRWEEGFGHLQAFVEREGHARVAQRYKTPNGHRLGAWVNRQRTSRDDLTPVRKECLGALPGWSWDPLSDQWEEGFGHLKAFVEREGHARVPIGHETPDGFRLGTWVSKQRGSRSSLSPEYNERLGELPGWSWDPLSDQWEEGFGHLKVFVEREGHARVPIGHETPGGYRLGKWVRWQRSKRDGLSAERKERLSALPGWSWDPFSDQWEEGFGHLKAFVEREGHARVSQQHETPDGNRLGTWVSKQRSSRRNLSPERKDRLEALPGWSWNPQTDRWEEGFDHLKAFVQLEGHARVPDQHETPDGYRLGTWVGTQRRHRDNLSQERKARLEALTGWSWPKK